MFGSSPFGVTPLAGETAGSSSITVTLAPLASGESWGVATLTPGAAGATFVSPAAIRTAEAWGAATLAATAAVGLVAIPSAELWRGFGIVAAAPGGPPATIEAAIRTYLDTRPEVTGLFPGGIKAGRKQPRPGATGQAGQPFAKFEPYLRIETPTGIAVFFSSTSVVQNARVYTTCYAATLDAAETLGNAVFAAFKGQAFPHLNTACAPLVLANRVHGEEGALGVGGDPVHFDRIEWTCRLQTAR